MSRYTYELEKSNTYYKREELELKLKILLMKESCPNILLCGESGSGKTELIANLDNNIVTANLSGIVAGTHYRGVLEEKIMEIINDCINEKKILFIDEIHNLSNMKGVDGGLNILDMLKPFLTSKKLRVIGATTPSEIEQLNHDKAFMRRFIEINIPELTNKELLEVYNLEVEKCKEKYEIELSTEYFDEYFEKILKKKENKISTLKEDIDTVFCIKKNFTELDKKNINKYLLIND